MSPIVLQEVECGQLNLVSSDARRDILEFEFGSAAFTELLIKDGSKPLGQHFHREKFEVFYFIEGSGVYRTALVDDNGRITDEVRSFKIKPGVVIRVPPMHAHRTDLAPGTRFVCFSSKPFNQDDMIACPIG